MSWEIIKVTEIREFISYGGHGDGQGQTASDEGGKGR
nr:MAG TPA: hypothetical protein [Crassvirales sp.]